MESNFSLADIAAVLGGRDREGGGLFGGGMGAVILIVLFLLFMFRGGNFGGNDGRAVTEADLCSSQSFTELKQGVARNGDAISGMYTGLQNGLSNLGYETLRNFNTVQQQIATCCCGIERAIDGVNYNGAINTSNIIQAQERGTQKILDYMCGQETQRLRDENMRNYIASQFCGVVRYPMATSYVSNCNPFNWGNCCNGQNF